MIPFVLIPLGEGGLPRCCRCAPESASLTHRTIADVRQDIEHAVANAGTAPGPNVILGGTEAFSHPDLPAIVVYAAEHGVSRIALETGGGPLTVGENAPGAIHVGVRHLIVHYVPTQPGDLDGAAAAVVSVDPMQLALDGIRAFVRAADAKGEKVAVSATVPVCRHTASLLPSAIVDLVAAGVGSVRLDGGAAGDAHGSARTAHVTAACDTGVVNGVWVDVAGVALPSSHAAHVAPGVDR